MGLFIVTVKMLQIIVKKCNKTIKLFTKNCSCNGDNFSNQCM